MSSCFLFLQAELRARKLPSTAFVKDVLISRLMTAVKKEMAQQRLCLARSPRGPSPRTPRTGSQRERASLRERARSQTELSQNASFDGSVNSVTDVIDGSPRHASRSKPKPHRECLLSPPWVVKRSSRGREAHSTFRVVNPLRGAASPRTNAKSSEQLGQRTRANAGTFKGATASPKKHANVRKCLTRPTWVTKR